jgi:hypothetical protein
MQYILSSILVQYFSDYSYYDSKSKFYRYLWNILEMNGIATNDPI